MDLIAKCNRHIMLTQLFSEPVGIGKSVSRFFRLIDVMSNALRVVFERLDTDIGADKSKFGFGIDTAKSFESRGSHKCISEPVGKNDEYFHN